MANALQRKPAASRLDIGNLPWADIQASLWKSGFARMGTLLTRSQCEEVRNLYADACHFRSRIDMSRYRFGRGEYQYFDYPLPELVSELRESLYRNLAGVANEWMYTLKLKGEFPGELSDFTRQCHARGQKRPTPLLLRYREGDYNCLHQDLYGEIVFPFQVIICLSRPGEEFTGGELLLVEQRPRAQSAGYAVGFSQGEAVVITTRYRPASGARGHYRTNIKHGVSPILSGERYTLGIVFHDAE